MFFGHPWCIRSAITCFRQLPEAYWDPSPGDDRTSGRRTVSVRSLSRAARQNTETTAPVTNRFCRSWLHNRLPRMRRNCEWTPRGGTPQRNMQHVKPAWNPCCCSPTQDENEWSALMSVVKNTWPGRMSKTRRSGGEETPPNHPLPNFCQEQVTRLSFRRKDLARLSFGK